MTSHYIAHYSARMDYHQSNIIEYRGTVDNDNENEYYSI